MLLVLNLLLVIQALVECEGNSIDLSGDIGSIGRVVISDSPSRKQEMLLDLKGIFIPLKFTYFVVYAP